MIRGGFVGERRGALHDHTVCRTVSRMPGHEKKRGRFTRHVSNCLQIRHPNSFHWPCYPPCFLFSAGSYSSKLVVHLRCMGPIQMRHQKSRACRIHFHSPYIFHCLSSRLPHWKVVCHCLWSSEAQLSSLKFAVVEEKQKSCMACWRC